MLAHTIIPRPVQISERFSSRKVNFLYLLLKFWIPIAKTLTKKPCKFQNFWSRWKTGRNDAGWKTQKCPPMQMSVTACHSLGMSSTIMASCGNTWHSRSTCLHAHEGNEIQKWRMYDVNWYLQYNVYCIPCMNISITLREQDQSLPNRYYLNKVHFDSKIHKTHLKIKVLLFSVTGWGREVRWSEGGITLVFSMVIEVLGCIVELICACLTEDVFASCGAARFAVWTYTGSIHRPMYQSEFLISGLASRYNQICSTRIGIVPLSSSCRHAAISERLSFFLTCK